MGFRDYVLKYSTTLIILTGWGIAFWLFWHRLISPFLFHMFLRYLKPTSSDRFVNSMLSYVLSSEQEITLKEWKELRTFHQSIENKKHIRNRTRRRLSKLLLTTRENFIGGSPIGY